MSSTEGELNPQTVIICNDLERYSAFAALLEKNGYPSRTLQNFPDEESPGGTVYFVSFNLHSSNAVLLAKRIEQMGKICIVFAEETGVQTAAKLSSAKMKQTLQFPYTEKNFVMAMQTIVKNRKAQNEKEQRKKNHEERLKAQQKSAAPVTDAGLIIQTAPEQITDDSAKVFKGDAAPAFSLTQIGKTAKGFFAIQESPSPERTSRYSTAPPPEKLEHEAEVLSYSEMRKKKADGPSGATGKKPAAEIASMSEENAASSTLELKAPAPVYERPMSHFWAVLGMSVIGSAICLYCVYQILAG